MNLAQLGALLALNLAGAASPGPDVLLITRMATRSRRHALAATAGIQIGVLFWCTLTVLGAAALLNAFPAILGLVQLIGGGWLLWMGYQQIVGGLAQRLNPPANETEAIARLGSLRSAFWYGLSTNLSNPKIVLYLSAMIAPLLPAEPSLSLSVLVVALLALSALVAQMTMALVISTSAMRRRLLAWGPSIDIISGVLFLLVGAILLMRGMADLL
ncbi:LysE family translocator [Corynebacterium alimapuense]|uniref:Lysine transporter LysE n=1 Tax=Corynebacterium alimapuense TaxID=1576874 RepID=A0A3M8K8S4_9CORY|nr:LysE family translocator [Corynebacterium alimapuense]RNE49621.1 lysine transporter LysE [Corynebacterium alimapuense]